MIFYASLFLDQSISLHATTDVLPLLLSRNKQDALPSRLQLLHGMAGCQAAMQCALFSAVFFFGESPI